MPQRSNLVTPPASFHLVRSGNSISRKRHESVMSIVMNGMGLHMRPWCCCTHTNAKPHQQGFLPGGPLREEMPSEVDNGLFASSIKSIKLFLAEPDRRTNHVLIKMLHPGSSRNR